MEKQTIEKDIRAVCVTADSFPEGILAAHQKLHALIPFSTERGYYGISHGKPDGGIEYKAAAGILNEGEVKISGLEIFTIQKGEYLAETLKNYRQNLPAISETFERLLADPRLDPNGYCLEEYLTEKDMRCLVKLADNSNS